MYHTFYNLKENPFNVTSDPAFFFSSTNHNEAFSHLNYGIEQRKGIIVVTGEIGTGKTTLCRTLINRLNPNIKTALILNPDFSQLQLLQMIMKDLGIACEKKNKLSLVNALNNFLIEESSRNNNVAVIIDEAQNLRPRQLEQIRLLSNLETEKEKLLQIILVGQPELYDKLKLPQLRQVNQRVTVRYHILPLKKEEVKNYITHRVDIALNDPNQRELSPTFNDDAIESIFKHSKGTPRLINIICDRALLGGFVSESRKINQMIIDKAAEELI